MLHASIASIPSLPPLPSPDAERRRVAAHIARAEAAARAADVGSLDRLTRLVRTLLLDELARYRADGVFPQNPDFAEPTPYFIDAAGTRCAMAHLLEVGGEGELVARIARERNNAWVRELADEPRLIAWLAAAGLTVGEAAMIQPSYCSVRSECFCGEAFFGTNYPVPADGVLEGEVVTGAFEGQNTIRIDVIHGDGLTHAVGDRVQAYVPGAEVGARVLVPVARPVTMPGDPQPTEHLNGIVLAEDGTYTNPQCSDEAIDAALFIRAVTSGECSGTLEAADSHWEGSTCSALGDCAVGQSGSPSTLGVLLAVVAALVWRRVRR